MKISKPSKIGILVILCLTVLIWGINFLKGRDIFRTEKVFYARYKNVGGLTATTLVTLNGLKIGYVREIYFAEDHTGDLIVKIAVHNNFPLPKGTSAQIASSDFLGSKVVKLNLGHSEKILQANDTLNSQMDGDLMQQVNEQIAPIKAKAERLIEDLDSIVSAASKFLNNDSQRNISESIRQIHSTMNNLESLSASLNEIVTGQKKNLSSTISNINDISGNLKKNSGKLEHMITNFSSFSDSLSKLELNKTVEHINGSVASLNQILSKIDTANGTIGLLVKDPKLYQNITSSTESLNQLLVDLRRNPKRYVHFSAIDFGKKTSTNMPEDSQIPDNVKFKIQISISKSSLPLTSPLFKEAGPVFETKLGDDFYYFTEEFSSYSKVRMILNKVQDAFPQALLKCYQNGKEISFKKVLKLIKK